MTADLGKARDAIERTVKICDTLGELTQMSLDEYLRDTRTQWAVGMGFIRIGEGVNKIPGEVLERFDAQPWRQIVAMRNFAAHQYEELGHSRVWRTATVDIPALRTYLAEVVLKELE